MIEVHIFNNKTEAYRNEVLYGAIFSAVNVGSPIIYMNSVYRMALAIKKVQCLNRSSNWKISTESMWMTLIA